MRPWQFSKPKNPGFGINKNYYLSVLSSRPVMPSILEIVNPASSGGAIEGFGAPLSQNAAKDDLAHPLERGAYVVATKDRKTVLKMLVLSKEEAGFDPEPFARSALAMETDPEILARVRATWTLAQLTFESHHAMVYPALDFLLSLVTRLADLSEGVVADPVCQRYLLPEQVVNKDRLDPRVDARDHVVVRFRERPEGVHAYTLGMQKFVLPEFEIVGLLEEEVTLAARFLIVLCQSVLLGDLARSGDRFGVDKLAFEAREGGFDPALWDGIPVLELLPPTTRTAGESLRAWQEATQ